MKKYTAKLNDPYNYIIEKQNFLCILKMRVHLFDDWKKNNPFVGGGSLTTIETIVFVFSKSKHNQKT